MKNNSLLAVAVLLITVFPFPRSAVGQTPVLSADCKQDPGCLTLKEQAAERSKSGDLVEALRLYKLAYEVRPDPRLLFNIARLLHKQGKMAEAVPYYQKFIDAPIQEEEQQKQKAREYLEQMQAAPATPRPKQIKKPPSQATASLPASALRVDASPSEKPVYKKWWFWTIVGGVAAAGIVAGIAGGVVANQQPQPQLQGLVLEPWNGL